MIREEINDELLVELAIWRETGKPTEKIGMLFFEIATILISESKYQFLYVHDKEDMVNHAVNHCLKHGIKFDSNKTKNALMYMRILIKSSFAGRWLQIRKGL